MAIDVAGSSGSFRNAASCGRLLNIAEAQHVLGVGRSSIYKLIEEERLRSVKIGKSRRIWTRDIEEFLESLVGEKENN